MLIKHHNYKISSFYELVKIKLYYLDDMLGHKMDFQYMRIRVLANRIMDTDKRHGLEIIITDNSDLSIDEHRVLEAFIKLDLD